MKMEQKPRLHVLSSIKQLSSDCAVANVISNLNSDYYIDLSQLTNKITHFSSVLIPEAKKRWEFHYIKPAEIKTWKISEASYTILGNLRIKIDMICCT